MAVKEEIQNLGRMHDIIETLLKAGFAETLERTGLKNKIPFIQRIFKDHNTEPSPSRLRNALEELGPTFIKLGQILAQRPDLLSEDYIHELEKLEDQVAPVNADEIVNILEESLGRDKDDIFKEFNMEPLASASIAQVHRATLKNGDKVAVKVVKPGVRQSIQTDLRILRRLVREAELASSYLRKIHFTEIFEQFEQWTRNEIDLTKEAKNAIRLKKNLKNDRDAYVPEIYWDYATKDVMVSEYINGIKIDNVEQLKQQGHNTQKIASNGVTLVLKQVLRDGFFHGDPHPANVLVDKEGRIVYLDYGIIGKISPRKSRYLSLMLLKALSIDADGVVNSLLKIADVDKNADIDGFKDHVETILLEAKGEAIADQAFSLTFLKIVKSAADHGIILPTQLVAGGKALIQAEGIGLTLNPDFQPSEELRSTIQTIILRQNQPQDIGKNLAISLLENRELIENAPQNIADILNALKKSNRISLEESIDIGAKEMAGAIFAAGLILSGSVILTLTTRDIIQTLAVAEILLGLFVGIILLKVGSQ